MFETNFTERFWGCLGLAEDEKKIYFAQGRASVSSDDYRSGGSEERQINQGEF